METLAEVEEASEATEEKQKPAHLWKPGMSGNPLGRPKGSRNRLGEDFIRALSDDFNAYGMEAIRDVRINSPKDYLKVIASVLPKNVELDLEIGASPELQSFIQDFRIVREAAQRIGAPPILIEAFADEEDA